MFSKGLFQTSTSKNCFGQMEFNLTKMREVFIYNKPIIKNLLHCLHSNHRLGEFKISSQVIFQKSTILLSESSLSKAYFEELEMILEKLRHGFCWAHVYL